MNFLPSTWRLNPESSSDTRNGVELDFTFAAFARLLEALRNSGYRGVTTNDPALRGRGEPGERIVFLRHDVDQDSPNALRLAQLERPAGLTGIYYFRNRRGRFARELIEGVAVLGHEIGYHYDCYSQARGDRDEALRMFARELEALRRIAPVRTASMHGSPLSRWDNRALWEVADRRKFGIEFEPYLDLDRKRFAYLTDTGRSWDGHPASVRDRMDTAQQVRVRTTNQFIKRLERGSLPAALMITIHPQRWNGRFRPWLRELVWQNLKNPVKRLVRVALRLSPDGKRPA